MELRVTTVDAFDDPPRLRGNPAGVCLPDTPLPDQAMQAIAAHMNLSETAFAVPRKDGDYDLRWFTPTCEVDLCGHATLATAAVLENRGAKAIHKLGCHAPCSTGSWFFTLFCTILDTIGSSEVHFLPLLSDLSITLVKTVPGRA